MAKKLFVELEDELHTDIKVRAAERNITIKTWVIRAIKEAIKKEQQYE